ncbi:MAG: sulfatase-like hydrolase/transferase [Thermoleophilaceae bacterium]
MTWRCWLAAELAAAVLLAGCTLPGTEEQAHSAERRPPVVFVVFDEFPADDLLRPDGSIDADRFPNFARLASISTWFPNATTVFDSTFGAVPAILDGRLPRPRMATDVRSHKPSIFHVLDRLGYEVFKVESASAVCPPSICPGARTRRPGVLARLAGGGRPARFHKWLGAIRNRPQPAFYFQHALMPHEPWIYLPSGRQSRPAGEDPIPDLNHDVGFDDDELTDQNHLRHLLQVGYTDRLIGELLRRLERTGLLERALLVVTADHGYSFRVGVKSRRLISEDNVEEIAPVPLFVKAPGQMERHVNRAAARNIDMLATIADLLGSRVFYEQDGRSAFSREVRARHEVDVRTRDFAGVVRIELPELEERRESRRREHAEELGEGKESTLLYGDPWASAYRVGPHPELIGRAVGRLATSGAPAARSARATVANRELYEHVSRDAQVLPTRVTGSLLGVPAGEHRDLAIAVNGRIRATSRSFDFHRGVPEYYSFQLPETALRPGRNRLQIVELR